MSASRPVPRTGTRILMFHRVLPNEPVAFDLPGSYRLRGTALTPRELEHALDQAQPILPLARVEAALVEGREPPAGSVLTFDDGYREHLDIVTPMLESRHATATFYVATGIHGGGGAVAAVDAWYWLLDHSTRVRAAIPMPDGSIFRGRLDTLHGKLAWITGPPKTALLDGEPTEQRQMLDALADSAGCELPRDLAATLYLRPDEWAALAGRSMRIGAHSVTHPRLPRLSGDHLHNEVESSIAAVKTFAASATFAYPDGAADDRVADCVRRSGAISAVTCDRGVVSLGTDPMRLPRWFVSAPASALP